MARRKHYHVYVVELSDEVLLSLRQGRFAARCGCLDIARHENSFGGMLCLGHKISDRLRGYGSSLTGVQCSLLKTFTSS
jgi:hypothetical protein